MEENNEEKIMNRLKETLIQVGLRIAKRDEGALFVIGKIDHKNLVDQIVPSFKVIENPKLLESLALIDGAVIINKDGMLKSYGAMIKSTKTLKNFGTRHSAALSASKKDNLVILVSEEDKKLKIFKDGKMIMQIDALQKGIEKSIPGAIKVLESVGAGAVGTIGAGLLVPSLGIALLPGIIVFGSVYYLGKLLNRKFNNKK